MGLLEDILARAQYVPQMGGWPAVAPPVDEAALAEAAREAAAAKLTLANRRRPANPLTLAPDAQSAGIRLAMDQAPEGTGIPFSTQAGMLAPPVTVAPPADSAPDGSVPLPTARPAEADLTASTPTDVSAASRRPAASIDLVPPRAIMSADAPPRAAEPSMFGRLGGRLMSGLENNSNLLLAMGAGFAGAPNIGQAISRASAAAIPAHAADVKQRLTQQTQEYTTKMLRDAGVPIQQAIAASGNPKLMEALIQNYIVDRKGEIKNIKMPNGTEMSVIYNPYEKKVTDMQGKPIDFSTMPGVIDPSLTGEDAAAAARDADPALYKRATALVEGREAWPNGRAMNDPKTKAATELARQIDPNLTEQTAQQRSVYMKDAANTKSGLGFQVKGFHQGIEHLWGMAKDIEKFNPSSGMGSADLAHLVNSVKQRFGENSSLARSIQARAQAVSGEVGKLYSGNTAGGVHEREKTAALFGTGNSSATELAGSLQGTIDLMEGGLSSLEQNRDRTMGERGSKHPSLQFRNSVSDSRIEDIRHVIKRLKGEEEAARSAASAPAAVAPKPGRYVYDPSTGKMVPAQ